MGLAAAQQVRRHTEASKHFISDPLGPAGSLINHTPCGQRPGGKTGSVFLADIHMPLEAWPVCVPEPCTDLDLISGENGIAIVNLVTQHDEDIFLLQGRRSHVPPMGRRNILHPFQVDDIVYMPEHIKIPFRRNKPLAEGFSKEMAPRPVCS